MVENEISQNVMIADSAASTHMQTQASEFGKVKTNKTPVQIGGGIV